MTYTDILFHPSVLIWGIYWNKLGKNEVELEILSLT